MKASTFAALYTSGHFTLRDVKGELLELIEEIRQGNLAGARDELGDVLAFSQMWLVSQGLDFTLAIPLATLVKFARRRRAWVRLFAAEGLTFSPRYLSGGANWRKPEKVALALAKARAEQG